MQASYANGLTVKRRLNFGCNVCLIGNALKWHITQNIPQEGTGRHGCKYTVHMTVSKWLFLLMFIASIHYINKINLLIAWLSHSVLPEIVFFKSCWVLLCYTFEDLKTVWLAPTLGYARWNGRHGGKYINL